jgi:hypothetical protein
MHLAPRVTRLGDFFTFGMFLKIKEVAHFGAIFSNSTRYVLILTNNWLGYILGDFFTNSSGHPACAF